MSDFKFGCPGCGQRISATDEYVGQQITCPSCQATIVVPASPASAAAARSSIATPLAPGAPPPPTPPSKGRLSVTALSSPQEHSAAPPSSLADVGAVAFQAHMAKKQKKSYTGLITGISAALVLGIVGITSHAWIAKKYKDVTGITAEEAATNVPPPPPPPPELTVDEIWQKVAETYKGLPNMTATGKSISVLDYSKVSTALAATGPRTSAGDLTIKATRPNDFRIDLNLSVGGSNYQTSGWVAGNGSFIQANEQRYPEPSPETVMDYFGKGYGVGPGDVVRLFVDDVHGTLPTEATDWARTNDDQLNGQTCYVLTGTVRLQPARVWVDRKTFLITQTQVDLDGESSVNTMDDNQIKTAVMAMTGAKQVTTTQIKTVRQMAKIKGTVTDTYQNIQTNAAVALADLEPPKPAVPVVAATPVPVTAADEGGGSFGGGGGAGGGGGRGGGRRR